MKKTILATLIAATALVPVSASAQRGDNNGGGLRQVRDAADRLSSNRAQQQPQSAPATQRDSRGGDGRQWSGQRGNQQGGQQGARGDRNGGRRDGAPGWNGQRDGRPDARRDGNWDGRRDGRPNWNNSDRRDWNGRRDDRRDWRQDGRRFNDWRDDRRWQNGWDDRRNWNRGWRGDNRYGWQRYRQSNRNIFRLPRYYAPSGWGYGYQRFGIGFTLNSLLFSPSYWIDDPFNYRLPPAYGGYRWVRYYNDALLVDVRTGEVVDVEHDIFW